MDLPGCNGDVLNDSTFRLWCGEKLCDWQLDAGHVNRVPTWHPNDYGVELADTPTQISQETSEGSDCMEFSAVANVAASANVQVGVDYDLDGTVDHWETIPESDWHVTKTLLYGPVGAAHLNFVVRKNGDGRAVLAEIRLQRVTTCSGSRIALPPAAIGGTCAANDECQNQVCCKITANFGICSQCCETGGGPGCRPGATCATPSQEVNAAPFTFLPDLCDPGKGEGQKGEPCVAAGDCASHQCVGALLVSASCDGGAKCQVERVRAGTCD